jgi:hypothetical protein
VQSSQQAMTEMVIDKRHIARSQLLTAIDLHFNNLDPISVHSLAGSSREIIEALCRKNSIEPFTPHIKRTFPEKTEKEIWKIMNLYRNAFKHADADDGEIIEQFSEEKNDYIIYVAVEDYINLRKASPVQMQVFQVWFCAVHEDRLADDVDKQRFRTAFPGILKLPRNEQKLAGKEMIASALLNEVLLADPGTERP